MFSFSAYTTTLPFGTYMPDNTGMVCADDFESYIQEEYEKDYNSTAGFEAVLNAGAPAAQAATPSVGAVQQLVTTNIPEKVTNGTSAATIYNGGLMELLDYETGEVPRLVDGNPLLSAKNAQFYTENELGIGGELNTFDQGADKTKQIWMPTPRDAETGQHMLGLRSFRRQSSSIAEIGTLLPTATDRQSRLATPVAPTGGDNASMSVDVDEALLNSFDMRHLDLAALDREVSLTELGSLLDNGGHPIPGKDKFASFNGFQLRAQQQSKHSGAAFDMATAENFLSSPAGVTVSSGMTDDILTPSTMTANSVRADQQNDAFTRQRRYTDWPQMTQQTSSNELPPNRPTTIQTAADPSTVYYPAPVSAQQQQVTSPMSNTTGKEMYDDGTYEWPPNEYDYFGQESFVFPTASQAWRYDLSYVGAYVPLQYDINMQYQQQEPQQQQQQSSYMMPNNSAVANNEPIVSTSVIPEQQSITSIEALLNSPSNETSSYPIYAAEVQKNNINILNNSGGFMMPIIKTEAEPIFMTMISPTSDNNESYRVSNKHESVEFNMQPISDSQQNVARALEVASFHRGNGDGSRGSSSSHAGSKIDQSLGDIDGSSGLASNKRIFRDRKLVEQHKLPFSYQDIVWMPVEEFNTALVSPVYSLTSKQRDLLKDIRRRGKNKVAARNCRRRKVDQIDHLDEAVRSMRDRQSQADNDLLLVDANLDCAQQVLAKLRRQVLMRSNNNLIVV